jgi:signal peptidase I
MIYDFSFVLVVLTVLFGLVLLWWRLTGRKATHVAEVAATPEGAAPKPEPWPVEYATAFFPVVVGVLILRAFLFEPFRIPSDSMMPTLLDGDFILVNKFTYGLRLPVINQEFVKIGQPERGDVIVFRHPADHSVTYIKRLVGLPGDHIQVRGDAIWVNGQAITIHATGEYTEDECYLGFRQAEETIGKHTHRLMYCPVFVRRPGKCGASREYAECPVYPEGADAKLLSPVGPEVDYDSVVPAGMLFFMGDNRDNSEDSRRSLGFVPRENVVGRAVGIWFVLNGKWGRIGQGVN